MPNEKTQEVLVHDPGQDRLIKEVYCFIAIDPRTNLEGICGLGPFPAMTSSPAIADSMKDFFKTVSEQTGKKIILVKFDQRTVISTIGDRNAH